MKKVLTEYLLAMALTVILLSGTAAWLECVLGPACILAWGTAIAATLDRILPRAPERTREELYAALYPKHQADADYDEHTTWLEHQGVTPDRAAHGQLTCWFDEQGREHMGTTYISAYGGSVTREKRWDSDAGKYRWVM